MLISAETETFSEILRLS